MIIDEMFKYTFDQRKTTFTKIGKKFVSVKLIGKKKNDKHPPPTYIHLLSRLEYLCCRTKERKKYVFKLNPGDELKC